MVARRKLDFLHRVVVVHQQSQIVVGGGVSVLAFRYARQKRRANLHRVVERVDADRLEINLSRRHDLTGGAKMPLPRQFRDVELTHHHDIAGRQSNQHRPQRQQPHIPTARLNPIHPPPGDRR